MNQRARECRRSSLGARGGGYHPRGSFVVEPIAITLTGPEDESPWCGPKCGGRPTARVLRAVMVAPAERGVSLGPAVRRRAALWVPRTLSTSRDQAILVDQTTDASRPSDAVLLKIDRFG